MTVGTDVADIDAKAFKFPKDEFLHLLGSAKEIGDGAFWRIFLDDIAVDESFLALERWVIGQDMNNTDGLSFEAIKFLFAKDVLFSPRAIEDG